MLAAIALLSAITPAVLMTAPVVAAQLAKQFALTPTQTGALFSAEMGAMSLATIPSLWWLRRVNWRCVAAVAAVIFVVGNLVSASVTDYSTLFFLRLGTALAGGTLMIVCKSSAAGLPNPSRVYGLWVMSQLVLGAIGLWLLPGVFSKFGISAFFLALAGLMLASMPLIATLPSGSKSKVEGVTATTHYASWCRTLFAILLFYISLSAVWTFISGLSSAAHLPPSDSTKILSLATLLGIVGSFVTAAAGRSDLMARHRAIGYTLMLAAIVALVDAPGIGRFAVAVLCFKFSWSYLLPLLLGQLARQDPSGRAMSFSSLVVGGGLAIGPLVGGLLVERFQGYNELLIVSIATLAASAALIMTKTRSTSIHVFENAAK